MNYAYTFLALSAFGFLVLNLPVPNGRLTPAASSIFNIVSSVTLLSLWGAGFPCVSREGVSVHHTTLSLSFSLSLSLSLSLSSFLMFWSSLSLWALPNSSTVLDRYTLNNLSSNWGKGVLYCTEKWKSHSSHCCCCCQLSNFKHNIQHLPTTGRINPNTQLTYHVDVHSNTEKLNCRHFLAPETIGTWLHWSVSKNNCKIVS